LGRGSSAGAKQWQHIVSVDRHAIEVRNGDTEQADTLVGRQQRAHEFNACSAEEIAAGDCRRETERLRVIKWKSANFTFTVTVRAKALAMAHRAQRPR
jgi:hypothetical protein